MAPLLSVAWVDSLRNILYLVHRLPYPPNKGDKVRSYNILKHLSLHNNVYLGTFVDDVNDLKFIPHVSSLCKELYVEEINPMTSKIRSLVGLFKNSALTLNYYYKYSFHNWVNSIVNRYQIDAVVVFSSAMAQYVDEDLFSKSLIDFVDVDSQKWNDFSVQKSWPLSWLYRREFFYLLKYERDLARKVKHSFFVTEKEKDLFSYLAPESFLKTSALNNGVDSDFFSNVEKFECPFISNENNSEIIPIVFTGAMDYWPNIDAVVWFVENVFSVLIKNNSCYRFYIVGRSPSQAVLRLSSKYIVVTGTVNDVRPYLQHAIVVVAPLRIARGIQNKILEAMSMAKPVVASVECVKAIDAVDGVEIISATTPQDFIESIEYISKNKIQANLIGYAARINIIEKYSWSTHLKKIDLYLDICAIE